MAKKQNGISGRDQYSKPPRSYGTSAEPAQHRTQGVSETYGGTLTSRQPASRYPREATSSENRRATELLKSDFSKVEK